MRPRAADSSTRLKLVMPSALLATGEGPKMAPGCVLTTSLPLAARAMASLNAAILVRVYGSWLGFFVTGASSRSRPPAVSKKVPVLTATTRPQVDGLRGVEDVLGPADVHRLEVGHVLAGPAQQRGAVDGGVAALRRPQHGLGFGHVAGDDVDAERSQRCGVRALPGERADRVAPLHEQLADVGAGESCGAGHQDRLGHG